MQFWKTKTFRQQAKIWNKKLKDSGFNDQEIEIAGERVLNQRSTNAYKQATELERQCRLDYFRLLGYLANNTIFPNRLEQFILLSHAEGKTTPEIAEEMKTHGVIKNKRTIGFIIRRWQMRWGIKTWTLKQMNLRSHIKL